MEDGGNRTPCANSIFYKQNPLRCSLSPRTWLCETGLYLFLVHQRTQRSVLKLIFTVTAVTEDFDTRVSIDYYYRHSSSFAFHASTVKLKRSTYVLDKLAASRRSLLQFCSCRRLAPHPTGRLSVCSSGRSGGRSPDSFPFYNCGGRDRGGGLR